MKLGLYYAYLTTIALVALAGCSPSTLPATVSPATTVTALPTATVLPPTQAPAPTAVPATATPVPPTVTALPPAETPIPLSAIASIVDAAILPATHSVCAAGCDFTTIQAAVDDPGTSSGAVIEITDSIHTEAGIVVDKDITVQGRGPERTIVQAGETTRQAPERVFRIEEGASVILKGLTIRHGKPSVRDEHGGGIYNSGTLTLDNCVVTDNIADGGGGICSNGELLLVNTTVRNNIAEGIAPPPSVACGGGGGIKCDDGPLTLINTTVSGNQAGVRGRGWGGGVHVACNCRALFINTTISGNQSASDSGGVRVRGRLQLVNSTISNNTATGKGGGVYVLGKLDYVNSIIAKNVGKSGDCVVDSSYGFTFQGEGATGLNSYNLVGSGNCNPDYSGDPLLGPLADNGGAAWTHALLEGSPAIDAIPVVSCSLPIDQRGAPRPASAGGDTPLCDIGAFEWQP